MPEDFVGIAAAALPAQGLIAFQDFTTASIISLPDVMQTPNVINAREQDPILLYSTLAVMFFQICYGLRRAINTMERRTRQRMALAV